MQIDRRQLLGGLSAAIAAPYIVRSGILMPVKAIIKPLAARGITQVSLDGENWVAVAYLNIKHGRPPDYHEGYPSLGEYVQAVYPYRRVLFATGWTDGIQEAKDRGLV